MCARNGGARGHATIAKDVNGYTHRSWPTQTRKSMLSKIEDVAEVEAAEAVVTEEGDGTSQNQYQTCTTPPQDMDPCCLDTERA